MSVPSQMKSLRTQADHKIGVENVDVPKPEANEVLIRVKAVTLNPTDWKSARMLAPPGNAVGCDAFGEIVAVGSDLAVPLKVGQNVAYFEMGSFNSPRTGTFSEYALTQSDNAIIVPDGYDPYEAASWGIGGLTAVQTLFDKLAIKNIDNKISSLPSVSADSPQLLVWAASTSVGQFAVQLGRVAGYHVIATASEKNWDYLKSLGAADLYDYKDDKTPAAIHEKYPKLGLALDCFSEKGSTVAIAKSLGEDAPKGSKVCCILPADKAAKQIRPDVEFITSLVYTTLGRELKFGGWPVTKEDLVQDKKFIQPWVAGQDSIVHNLMAKKLVRGNKIKKMDGGIDSIEKGMDFQQSGQVSMEKLAYDIA